ncbi:hypothetical protein LTR86_005764 [Recurvomyces mirabilis]|nr:hypothetical protein LTR86_005764 [Recurvomyces mirabilis]
MRFHSIPRPLLQLITTILLSTPTTYASPQPILSQLAGFDYNELFARWDCGGTYCGYSSQLCCSAGSTCYTDPAQQAQCGVATATAPVAGAAGGYWSTYYTTFTETDTHLTTQLMSTYIGGAAATPTSQTCNYALNETPCGSICCASNQQCYSPGQCVAAVGGSSGYYSSAYVTPTSTQGVTGIIVATGTAPVRGTSSSQVLVTQTVSPTTTIPFQTPVATGANITLTGTQANNSGLSGGAIAGIVIGVLVALFLLALLCLFCCARGIWNAFFGGGRKKRSRVEVEEYERRSHRTSGGGGRTWYGARKPQRSSSRYDERRENKSGGGLLAVGGGLAALWALLGLKRKREDRNRTDEKYSDVSYSSDYYTSESSASSDDRRTRDAPRDARRSVSRR